MVGPLLDIPRRKRTKRKRGWWIQVVLVAVVLYRIVADRIVVVVDECIRFVLERKERVIVAFDVIALLLVVSD